MMPPLRVLSYIFATGLLIRTSLAIGWDCGFCGNGPLSEPDAAQLSGCVLTCLQDAPVNYWNCESVDCICPASHLPQAIAAITACATASCMNDPGGVALATNIALSYCQTWSQTAAPAVGGAATSTSTVASITPSATSAPVTSATTNQPTSTKQPTSTNQPTSTLNPTPATPSSLFELFSCAPCGNNKCSFTPGDNLTDVTYAFEMGTPISNCNPGSTANITNTIEGDLTLTDAWSTGASIGLNLGALNIAASASWVQTRQSTVSHSISMEVAPGQSGVMIAYVQYKRTSGSMQIDPAQAALSLISNQPFTVVSYSQEIVQCDSSFSANISQPFQCSSDNRSSCVWGFSVIFTLIAGLFSILWV